MARRRDVFTLGRRDLLRGAAVAGAPLLTGLGGCSSSDEAAPSQRFEHGVASGDPLPDAVILWTRVTAPGEAAVDVVWEVADDPSMTANVITGSFRTDPSRDFTVKVDVRGLQPGRAYYYRFRALGSASRVGRTRTAPSGSTSRVRLAMVSCASYAHGYFHGYRAVAGHLDLDAVIHLGDYIYEYGDGDYGDVRKYQPPTEILTLADYRTRHAHYKLDPDLQEVHRQHAFITIWDDHETANDAYADGAENHSPDTEGSFADRKAAARKAYLEWMPIREQGEARIFRRLAFGDLVDLVLLDTRLYARTKQAGGAIAAPPPPDPTRTLLGDEQAAWMEGELRASKARWKLLGQQVMVGNLILDKGKQLANLDQWQGYPESRTRLLTFFRDSGVKNIVVLTGDIHSSWANELVVDPNDPASYDPATGKGSLAVEIVTPGITSPGIPELFLGLIEQTRPINPHVRFVEPSHRGFVFLDITPERVQAAWYLFDDVVSPEPATPKLSAGWAVKDGETRLNADMTTPAPREQVPAAAP
jgi:alkaline phosphatase D